MLLVWKGWEGSVNPFDVSKFQKVCQLYGIHLKERSNKQIEVVVETIILVNLNEKLNYK